MQGFLDNTVGLMVRLFPMIMENAWAHVKEWFTALYRGVVDLFSQIYGAIFAGEAWTLDSPAIISAVLVVIAVIAILLLFILREPRRRFFVALKRKPQNIPMAVLLLAFVIYSFNLTSVSNTTTLIMGANMGLTGFATMLGSTLMLVCCLNAFPYRKKVNVFMLIMTFALILVVLYCDTYYCSCINNALTRETDAIVITDQNSYVLTALKVVCTHYAMLILGALLAALLPVYRPLIRMIRTSIDVEGNEDMDAIDISGE